MKMTSRGLLITAFVILFITSVIIFLQRPANMSYVTAPVRLGDIENAVLATGKLDAIERVNVGAQVSGQVKSLKLKIGDHVIRGQLIAEIDDMPQRNELRNSEAALNVSRAERLVKVAMLKQTTANLKRQKKMLSEEASSRQDYESAQAAFSTAQANLQELDARIIQAQIEVEKKSVDLSYTRILAPISGTVIAIVTRQGQTVNASQNAPTIVKLARLDIMTIKVQISEADINQVKTGQKGYFTIFSEPEKRYDATLRSIELAPDSVMKDDSLSDSNNANSSSSGSVTSNASVYYNALLDVPNPDNKLRIAMTAQVSLLQNEAKNTLLIPLQAIKKASKNIQQVEILSGGNHIESRVIKTGITNNVDIQVVEGLKKGEQVILAQENDSTNQDEVLIQ